MLTAIEFYHQTMFHTAEVSNEVANRVLATELGTAELSLAQS